MQPGVLLPAEPSSNSCSQFLKSIIIGPEASRLWLSIYSLAYLWVGGSDTHAVSILCPWRSEDPGGTWFCPSTVWTPAQSQPSVLVAGVLPS